MLQQTQVKTVIPYFEAFCARFPTVVDLADAEQDDVLHLWSGLGYYARARNLHHAAKQVVADFGGQFPNSQAELESLKGIGRSTAGAIRAQAFGEPAPILDGNVKRVLTRLFGIAEWPGQKAVETQLWEISESLLPKGPFSERLRDYTQAIMDFGATCCTRAKPNCLECPFQKDCRAFASDQVDKIPARKPKKPSPIKELIFMVLRNQAGEILLEKRPPTGIWGGLWSFPETTSKDLEQDLKKLAKSHQPPQALEQGTHVFSHFKLRYQPMLVDVGKQVQLSVNETQQFVWYGKEQGQSLGLAAPVSKLVGQIFEAPRKELVSKKR